MNIKQYIEKIESPIKGKSFLRKYLTGGEYKLFLLEG
jgi:hypothetical protein